MKPIVFSLEMKGKLPAAPRAPDRDQPHGSSPSHPPPLLSPPARRSAPTCATTPHPHLICRYSTRKRTRAPALCGLRRRERVVVGMRRFMPGGGGGREPPSSSSPGGRGGDRAAAGGLRYGGGDIPLGHDDGRPHLGVGAGERQQDGSMDMLARHSSSPTGFFSNLVMDNGELPPN
jgi:hypothetical protein